MFGAEAVPVSPFEECEIHENVIANFACFECSERGLCRRCVAEHTCCGARGRVYQIRRYMYQCVVLHDDVCDAYDVTGVQTYVCNGKRALLLDPKPPATMSAYVTACEACGVALRPDCRWCSLACKNSEARMNRTMSNNSNQLLNEYLKRVKTSTVGAPRQRKGMPRRAAVF